MGITGAKGNKREPGGWRNKLLQNQPQKTGSMDALKGQSPCLEKRSVWRSNGLEIPITRNVLEIPVSFLLNPVSSLSPPYRHWSLSHWLSHGSFHPWMGLCLTWFFHVCFALLATSFSLVSCLAYSSIWKISWHVPLKHGFFFQTTWHNIPEEHTLIVQVAWLSVRCYTFKEKQKNLFNL